MSTLTIAFMAERSSAARPHWRLPRRKAIASLATVLLYLVARRRLPETHGFALGRFEPLVVLVALLWLALEISIFRGSSFGTPWEYVAVMMGMGLIYFLYMLATCRRLVMPNIGTYETGVEGSVADGNPGATPRRQ
jgi:hypothetical protein